MTERHCIAIATHSTMDMDDEMTDNEAGEYDERLRATRASVVATREAMTRNSILFEFDDDDDDEDDGDLNLVLALFLLDKNTRQVSTQST